MTTATASAPPEKRAAAAAKRIAVLTPKVESSRAERNAAAAHLLRNEKRQPVQVYTLIGMSRGLFARMIDEHFPEGKPVPKVADAEKVAKRAAAAFTKAKAALEEQRRIRTEAVEQMLARGDSNADVARASRLTSARIAQVRKGGR
jgi:hypothetical protein